MWQPNTTFADPVYLWGLLVIPLLVYWYIRRHVVRSAMSGSPRWRHLRR